MRFDRVANLYCVMLFCVMLCIAGLPLSEALAWGADGHSVIAEIAQRRLTPAARQHVRELLGDASLASISSWADDIRGPRPETVRWHFADIALKEKEYAAESACRLTSQGDCIVSAVTRQQQALADGTRSRAERIDALKFVVHLVADIHQPLHAISDFQGGNKIRVQFFVDPLGLRKEVMNLHLLWDFGLIRHRFWSWGSYVDYLEREWFAAHQTEVASVMAPVDWAPVQWAMESNRVASTPGLMVPNGADLGKPYATLAAPILDRQIAIAGVRLAAVLNATLK